MFGAAIALMPTIAHAQDVGSGKWMILEVSRDQPQNGISNAQVVERFYPTMLDCAHDMLPMFGKAGGPNKSPYLFYCVFVPL
jgi:hypothetical protein